MGPKRYWGQQKNCPNNFLLHKNAKIILGQKYFGPTKILEPKVSWVTKKFWPKKLLFPKNWTRGGVELWDRVH